MLTAGAPAYADKDWGISCRNRMEAARARIDHDAARHGKNGPQVRRDVNKMEDTRRWCRDHYADWDHARFDVGVYHRH